MKLRKTLAQHYSEGEEEHEIRLSSQTLAQHYVKT